MSPPDHPKASPRLDYPEKVITSDTPSGEIDLRALRHDAKRRAAREEARTKAENDRARRRLKEMIAIGVALVGAIASGAVSIVKAFHHDDRDGVVELRLSTTEKAIESNANDVDKLRDRLEDTQLDVARCCAPNKKGGP